LKKYSVIKKNKRRDEKVQTSLFSPKSEHFFFFERVEKYATMQIRKKNGKVLGKIPPLLVNYVCFHVLYRRKLDEKKTLAEVLHLERKLAQSPNLQDTAKNSVEVCI
jgi:hypothetical protein